MGVFCTRFLLMLSKDFYFLLNPCIIWVIIIPQAEIQITFILVSKIQDIRNTGELIGIHYLYYLTQRKSWSFESLSNCYSERFIFVVEDKDVFDVNLWSQRSRLITCFVSIALKCPKPRKSMPNFFLLKSFWNKHILQTK